MGDGRDLLELLERGGSDAYFGEPISQLEHALQTAALADAADAPDALVVAALVHDVGHLLQRLGESAASRGIDARHEITGSRWLSRQRFSAAVTEPIRLHVAAKRYLAAVDPDYAAQLSSASRHSLALQGGAFGEADVAAFESEPYGADAVLLRRWDDAAKIVGKVVPGIDRYVDRLRHLKKAADHADER